MHVELLSERLCCQRAANVVERERSGGQHGQVDRRAEPRTGDKIRLSDAAGAE